MKPDSPAKHFLLAFLLALAGYVLCYQLIQYWRVRKGPWEVCFLMTSETQNSTTDGNGESSPAILIRQPALGITNVEIIFAGEILSLTNQAAANTAPGSAITLWFRQPQPVPYNLPFGKCIFMDTISLPGTVTFQMFGHEIELLPRVLTIDRQEYPWRTQATITLPK